MPTVLVIGASRGIGSALARQYVRDGWRTLATARTDKDIANLAELGAEPVRLDVTSANDWAALGWTLDGERLDVAIHNAGVYGPRIGAPTAPNEADFDAVMRVNVLAPMRMVGVVGPAVAAARGRLAVISSRMGAKAGRSSASGWLYRASKAAVNSVVVDAATVYGPHGAVCVAFHPGWARTDMGGEQADLAPDDSAAGVRRTIAALGSQDNGRFLDYDGSPIPW